MKIDIRDDTRPILGLLAGRATSWAGDAFEHRLRAATDQADLVLVATSDDGLVGVLSAATIPLRADAAATRPDDVTVGQNRRWCWLTLPFLRRTPRPVRPEGLREPAARRPVTVSS